MAQMIREEFSAGLDHKVKHDIQKISPVNVLELQDAIFRIKVDKATSLDCTTDYIVKMLCKYKNNKKLNKEQNPKLWQFRENLLSLVN